MSITQILTLSVEALQGKSLAELAELHNSLKDSKQKKAMKKADLIAGIINAKKKEAKEAEPKAEEKELVTVENSKKLVAKPKATAGAPKAEDKPKATVKPKVTPKAEEQEQEEQPKADKPKATVKSLKRPKQEQPDLSKMSQEQLMNYVQTLQEQTETFPSEIPAEKSTYNRLEFETLKDIQRELIERPMTLYLFADEKIDDKLTQFLVLFVNAEAIVLFDRNRQKNTTITLKPEQLEAEHITMDKQKFKYAFYSRVANK